MTGTLTRSTWGLTTPTTHLAWQRQALCQEDPDLWSTYDFADLALARHTCERHCPVLAECRAWARTQPWHGGIVVAGRLRGRDGQPTGRQPIPGAAGCGRCPPRDTPTPPVARVTCPACNRSSIAVTGSQLARHYTQPRGGEPCPGRRTTTVEER